MVNHKLLCVCIMFISFLNYNAVALTDSNPSNNMKSITVDVYETSNIKVLFVPVEFTSENFDFNFNPSVSGSNKIINASVALIS